MLVNNGDQEGLFRGAIMQSGGPIPVGDIDSPSAQEVYDTFVKNVACDNSADTLECLRGAPFQRLRYAMDISPNFFAYQVCYRHLSTSEICNSSVEPYRGLHCPGCLALMAIS